MGAIQSEESAIPEEVCILRFGSGDTEYFRKALLEGPQFGPCREMLQQHGYSCVHSSDALIFVRPEQFDDVLAALHGYDLHPFHVVITANFEYLLDEVLCGISCRKRPREKKGSRHYVSLLIDEKVAHENRVNEAQMASDGAEEVEWQLCPKRTFLCYAPRPRNPESVVQSMTEAVIEQSETHYTHYRGVNPRRHELHTMI